MSTTPTEPDLEQRALRRRRATLVTVAVAFVVALLLIGQSGRPQLGLVLIPVVLGAAFIANVLRNRRTREGTDERARENYRRATSFSWHVVAVALIVAVVWTQLRHGVRAAEPYAALLAVLVVSYGGAVLWRQWCGI